MESIHEMKTDVRIGGTNVIGAHVAGQCQIQKLPYKNKKYITINSRKMPA